MSKTNDNEILIRVEGVGKRFCKDLKRSLFYGVQDISRDLTGRSLAGRPLRKREFWANKDISFELRRGECLGLIGRNGAGKTTLLKMLNGLMKPDEGRIEIKGRVGALIALGAGFNPILTGRENVYVAGSVYGLSKKEINEKYDEIVAFAEMEEFMESPVQNYSSGMKVKLGFAVATAFKPDVLIIDEVLAVGDAPFRSKCINKLRDHQKNSCCIFVSHNIEQVLSVCNKGIMLEKGLMYSCGEIDEVANTYINSCIDNKTPSTNEVISTSQFREINLNINSKIINDTLECNLNFKMNADPIYAYARLVLINNKGDLVWESTGRGSENKILLKKGLNKLKAIFSDVNVKKGGYKTDIFIYSIKDNIQLIRVKSSGVSVISEKKVLGYAEVITDNIKYHEIKN